MYIIVCILGTCILCGILGLLSYRNRRDRKQMLEDIWESEYRYEQNTNMLQLQLTEPRQSEFMNESIGVKR